MRVIFLGTPSFAVPTLERLLVWDKCKVLAAVTQPDRPAGRHLELKASPIKLLAQRASIPVFQPDKLAKAPEIVEQLRALKPDIFVLVSFGQLLKAPMLTLAPHGVVNLHPSLLPKYRGAAPINWAIINGDTESGVTTMLLDEGMDTGQILLRRKVPIGINDTSVELAATMSTVGADLIIETLDQINSATVSPIVQDEQQATMAPPLTQELGAIKWSQSVRSVHNLVRGLLPWPRAYSYFNGARIKILKTAIPENLDLSDYTIPARWAAGLFLTAGDRYFVNCNQKTMDLLEILEVQPENRSPMPVKSWVNGFRIRSRTSIALGVFEPSVHQA